MKKISSIISIILALLVFPVKSFGQYTFPEHEIYQQTTIEKKTGIFLSRLSVNFKKISDNRYLLIKSGKGSYGKFRDVAWTIESETELNQNVLSPVYTAFTISDKNGKNINACKKEYDYNKKVIRITEKNANNKITEKSTLPLKTRTTDYATLIYFLRPFINDLIARKTISFNFLSSEPGLYKLKARFVKEDKLLIGSEEIETIKITIRPDMGAFNLILDRFVPPTLLWYTKESPHVWVKYEGLESGRGSTHIITTVEKEY
ncbi:MAG: hypothetical protein P9M07_06405 [Candidatus Aceula meridiana]|nr:hypothetical protein [Candidatus Aceula meridiana]